MLDNDIYNTKINNNTYVNIYSIYKSINICINNIQHRLRRLNKQLERLIEAGGPSPVTAQVYDKPHSTLVVKNPNVYYQDIVDTVARIKEVDKEHQLMLKQKGELEDTILEVIKLQPANLELKVFLGHHIRGETLYNLSKKLFYRNSWGDKVYYDYGYLRNINANILKKMQQCDNLLLQCDIGI